MKTIVAIALALCAIVSAVPMSFADTEKLHGAEFRSYNFKISRKKITNLFDEIEKKTADDTKIDSGKVFSLDVTDMDATVGKWSGYFKSEDAGDYTFTLVQDDKFKRGGFALRVNDNTIINWAFKQCSEKVSLKKGYNKIEIACRFHAKDQKVTVEYKPTDNVEAQKIQLTPGQMFYDKPVKKNVSSGK